MASNVQVFPLVTACDELSAPAACRTLVASVSPHQPAVCVAVTLPSVIAGVDTLRPSTAPLVMAVMVRPVLLPQLFVLVASV